MGADAARSAKAVRRKYKVAILLLDVGGLFRKLLRRTEAPRVRDPSWLRLIRLLGLRSADHCG